MQPTRPSRAPHERGARDALLDSIAVSLLNAGIQTPAAEFVRATRDEAGFRASPRQVATAIAELERAGQQVDLAAVARVVAGARGAPAERQRRNAEEWRALGAALTLRGRDGDPAGQRAFIGAARRVAGRRASDALLLSIALTLAGEGRALDPAVVGEVGKRLARSADDLTPDDIASLTRAELRALDRAQRPPQPRRRSSSAARRPAAGPLTEVRTRKPGKRRWQPGGRRRRTIKIPKRPT